MPEVNVTTNPMVVYGMIAVFGAAIVLALVFARPRRGLGAVRRSKVPDHLPGGQPWMPGGDIYGQDPPPEPGPPAAADPWPPPADQWPAADSWQAGPPAAPAPGGGQPPVQDPWSTGATGVAEPQPRWDKR